MFMLDLPSACIGSTLYRTQMLLPDTGRKVAIWWLCILVQWYALARGLWVGRCVMAKGSCHKDSADTLGELPASAAKMNMAPGSLVGVIWSGRWYPLEKIYFAPSDRLVLSAGPPLLTGTSAKLRRYWRAFDLATTSFTKAFNSWFRKINLHI